MATVKVNVIPGFLLEISTDKTCKDSHVPFWYPYGIPLVANIGNTLLAAIKLTKFVQNNIGRICLNAFKRHLSPFSEVL